MHPKHVQAFHPTGKDRSDPGLFVNLDSGFRTLACQGYKEKYGSQFHETHNKEGLSISCVSQYASWKLDSVSGPVLMLPALLELSGSILVLSGVC